jgi:RNA polymerase sigma-70 factor, ECF subfamily
MVPPRQGMMSNDSKDNDIGNCADEENNLVERARRGDAEAISELLSRHLPGLRSFVRRRAGADVLLKESSRDIVQSVCREALQDLDRFDGHGDDDAAFASWLYKTALRKILDKHRFYHRKKRDPRREQSPRGSSIPTDLRIDSHTPSRIAIGREATERTKAAMSELSPIHREALELYYNKGLSYTEIARRLDRSSRAVESLVARALAKLAGKIQRDC